MKVIVSTNEGTVVDIFENLQEYDLEKRMAYDSLMNDILHSIVRAKKIEIELKEI